jgi:D-aspartate ligase
MMPTELRNSKKPYAIVIGLDSMQGLQSARILSGHEVPVIGIASQSDYYSSRTNACEEILFVKTRGPKLLGLLERLGPTFKTKPVLFPCQDKNVLTISRNHQMLEQWYHVILPPSEVVEMMMDKVLFYRFAQKAGFPIPPTFFLHCKKDAEYAATQLTYPCILKPPSRPGSWTTHTKLKAIIADNPEQLLAQYEHYHEWAEVLIAQKLVEGDDSNLYSCNCYFDAQAEPLVTFVARKLRQWPPKTGTSCLGEEVRNDEVLQETVRLFREVNYRGLGYVEMKRDESTGKHYIIEPNIGRPTGRSAIAEAGGVELLYTMYCDAVGLPLPEDRQQKYEGVKWIHILRDLQSALYHSRRGDLTIREWWRSIRGRKAYAVFSWRDPLPFLAALYRGIPVMLSARERG